MSDPAAGNLAGAQLFNADLSGARFRGSDLSGVVIRGSEVAGMEIDSPWLLEGGNWLRVNGVDVVPLVDAALNARFPGRELRRASDPEGLRTAFAALRTAVAATIERAEGLPSGSVDESVDEEWSFSQTLRHLVMAIDTWLGKAVLGGEQPYHRLGQPNAEYYSDGYDPSVFDAGVPAFAAVLDAYAGRMAQVGDFLATVTPDVLDQKRPNPWAPHYDETVRSCLHTILDEGWEHLRYAVRDLDLIAERC